MKRERNEEDELLEKIAKEIMRSRNAKTKV
ncbi:unknown [Clostridium sp. CAG:273]|jgi:hypothetical protein|nr:unknown [Clostridium sp. CAG:273]